MAKSTPSDRKTGAKKAPRKSGQTELEPVEDAIVSEEEDATETTVLNLDEKYASQDTDTTEALAEVEDTIAAVDEASEDAAQDISEEIENAETLLEGTNETVDEVEAAVENADDIDPPTDTNDAEPTAEPVVAPTAPRKGGFFPLLLGGLVAGGIGFGASTYLNTQNNGEDTFEAEMTKSLGDQTEAVQSLTTRIDAVESAQEGFNLAPLQESIDGNSTTLQDALTEVTTLSGTVAEFGNRLAAIEKQPLAEAVSPEAIAAYERELEELRDVLDTRKTEIEELVANERAAMEASVTEQRSAIEALAAAADQAESSAEEKANLAAARNAMVDVSNAIDKGVPYGDALTSLTETGAIDVPELLVSAAEDGAPSQNSLTEAFPGLAYAALTQARKEKTQEEGHSFSNFLQTQLGGRSVVPREGDDPDAVLSRAEAAVNSSDIETAISELSALPDSIQPIFSDWVASATARKDILAAAAQLAQELNQK